MSETVSQVVSKSILEKSKQWNKNRRSGGLLSCFRSESSGAKKAHSPELSETVMGLEVFSRHRMRVPGA